MKHLLILLILLSSCGFDNNADEITLNFLARDIEKDLYTIDQLEKTEWTESELECNYKNYTVDSIINDSKEIKVNSITIKNIEDSCILFVRIFYENSVHGVFINEFNVSEQTILINLSNLTWGTIQI